MTAVEQYRERQILILNEVLNPDFDAKDPIKILGFTQYRNQATVEETIETLLNQGTIAFWYLENTIERRQIATNYLNTQITQKSTLYINIPALLKEIEKELNSNFIERSVL